MSVGTVLKVGDAETAAAGFQHPNALVYGCTD